jgi:ribosomal protein S18 acetylase RimI-like enzyme
MEIRTAAPDEASKAISCIVAAFVTDPLARFCWPDPEGYLEAMARLAAEYGREGFQRGTAYVTEDFDGAAFWIPPGAHADGEALEALLRETTPADKCDNALRALEKMDSFHPKEEHWYLPLIGVDPFARGRGLGATLMRHAVARCDQEGISAYLDSTNPRNISLYERHGFERLGEVRVGAAPLVTPMLRSPR